jgi:NAD-dependent dihydropyrimidine dehydrogenase PreA subunit
VRAVRQIVHIDEEKCTGCGDCIISCAEGAIKIIDGKAKLIGENLCDGLGACLGICPEDAIRIEEREADAFDEEAVKEHLADSWIQGGHESCPSQQAGSLSVPAQCPSSQLLQLGDTQAAPAQSQEAAGPQGAPATSATLSHWPIKLNLVPPGAPFLNGKDVVLMADCVAFASPEAHGRYIPQGAVLIGCPKFDQPEIAQNRLAEILRDSGVRSLTVVHMEVPCCSGYWFISQKALQASGADIPLRQVVVGVRGEIQHAQEAAAVQ